MTSLWKWLRIEPGDYKTAESRGESLFIATLIVFFFLVFMILALCTIANQFDTNILLAQDTPPQLKDHLLFHISKFVFQQLLWIHYVLLLLSSILLAFGKGYPWVYGLGMSFFHLLGLCIVFFLPSRKE